MVELSKIRLLAVTNPSKLIAENSLRRKHFYIALAASIRGDLPIAELDMCCSGFTFLALLTRDTIFGEYLNLYPSRGKSDLYTFIGDSVLSLFLKRNPFKNLTKFTVLVPLLWKVLSVVDTRVLFKQNVMVFPYGARLKRTIDYFKKPIDLRVIKVLTEEELRVLYKEYSLNAVSIGGSSKKVR